MLSRYIFEKNNGRIHQNVNSCFLQAAGRLYVVFISFLYFPSYFLDHENKTHIKIQSRLIGEAGPSLRNKTSACGSPDRPSRSSSAWLTSASAPSWRQFSWGTTCLFHSMEAFPSGEACGWVTQVPPADEFPEGAKALKATLPSCAAVPCRKFPATQMWGTGIQPALALFHRYMSLVGLPQPSVVPPVGWL